MSIQFISSFEDLSTNGGAVTFPFFKNWFDSSSPAMTNVRVLNGGNSSGSNESADPSPTNNGNSSILTIGNSGGLYTKFQKISCEVVDNTKLVIAGGWKTDTPYDLDQSQIISINSATDVVAFGLNGKFAALYINGVLASTSTINIVTKAPWSFIELFKDSSTSKFYLRVNGKAACDADIPVGFVATTVQLNMGRTANNYNNGFLMSEVIVYDSEDPKGPLFTHEFFKNSDVVTGFSGSSTSSVNARPFSNTLFRSSETTGASDMFGYSNILPNSVGVTEIVAVVQKAIASSGGVSGGKLNLRLKSGANNYDHSVSSSLTSTSPVLVQKVYETNPATSAPWTRAEVRAINTGYVVAD